MRIPLLGLLLGLLGAAAWAQPRAAPRVGRVGPLRTASAAPRQTSAPSPGPRAAPWTLKPSPIPSAPRPSLPEPAGRKAAWERAAARLAGAGWPETQAKRSAALWQERLERLRRIRDHSPQALRPVLESPGFMAVIAGLKPAWLAYLPHAEPEAIRAAVAASFPRLKVAVIESRQGRSWQALIYDPRSVLAALKSATASGLPEVSFFPELSRFQGDWARLHAWILEDPDRFRKFTDHRVGVILGYPPRDVAGFIANMHRMHELAIVIPDAGGAEVAEVSWMSDDPGRPETRAAAEAYGAALELGASILFTNPGDIN